MPNQLMSGYPYPSKNIVADRVKSTLLAMKNSGHVVNVEQPKTFNTETIQFIKELA